MNWREKDLTNQKFCRLTATSLSPRMSKKGSHYWLCLCECGNQTEVRVDSLLNGQTKSCGCLRKDRAFRKHGMYGTTEYVTWRYMIQRCTNPNTRRYCDWGGRGIIVCDRWRTSFENFYSDMGARPKGHSIERIDNDGPYCKENCRWVTSKEQARNRRNSVFLEAFGDKKTLAEWSEILKVNPSTIRNKNKQKLESYIVAREEELGFKFSNY